MGFLDFLNPLFDAMAWIIVQFHAFFGLIFNPDSGPAWALSIVLLVVVIRVCLIPLFVKQIKATRNMQVIQPQVKKIQQKYKHDKQRQQQEIMKLYKETGTNPFASCLPILIQSPFFLALYRVLSGIANGHPLHGPFKNGPLLPNGSPAPGSLAYSAQHAHFFGAPIATSFRSSADQVHAFLADPTTVKVVTIVMIVLMSASQFITQRQLILKNTVVDSAGANPFARQQKMLMYVFPIFFAVFGINFPVGVLIYWLTTNVWSMGQQMVVIRRNPTPGSIAAKQREDRLAAKKKAKAEKAAAGAGGASALVDGASADEPQDAAPNAPKPPQRHQPVRKTRSQRTGQQGQEQQGRQGQQQGQQQSRQGSRQGQGQRSGGSGGTAATRSTPQAEKRGKPEVTSTGKKGK